MEFNENQAEILSQAVANGKLQLPLKTVVIQPDVAKLIIGGMLTDIDDDYVTYPTPTGIAVVKIYQREQEAYQRGYDDGFRDANILAHSDEQI